MIPQFPKFKKIALRDKTELEAIIHQFDPYSDFNFVSLYSWNTDKNTALSLLNDNLVIRLKNYTGTEMTYSLLGGNKIEESLMTLIKWLPAESSIRLLPHTVIEALTEDLKQQFGILEDRDNHDYIYELERITQLQGNDFKKKRNMVKTFKTKYPQARFVTFQLHNPEYKKQILKLVTTWKENKDGSLNDDELIGLTNVFSLHKHVYGTGILHQNTLIGFSVVEHLHNNHAMIHYEKTDHDFAGVTEHLMVETAKHLQNQGIRYLNFEQDLGVDNLRKNKTLWRPTKFLKKYSVRL